MTFEDFQELSRDDQARFAMNQLAAVAATQLDEDPNVTRAKLVADAIGEILGSSTLRQAVKGAILARDARLDKEAAG